MYSQTSSTFSWPLESLPALQKVLDQVPRVEAQPTQVQQFQPVEPLLGSYGKSRKVIRTKVFSPKVVWDLIFEWIHEAFTLPHRSE